MQISKWHNIKGHTEILNRFFFLYKNPGQNKFCLFVSGGFKPFYTHTFLQFKVIFSSCRV